MRNSHKHNILVCLFCLTLLFTMGFDIETRINNHPETTSNPSVEMDSKAQITASNRSPKDQPVTENISSELLKSSEPLLHQVRMNEEQRIDELTNTEVTEANYEVTAYYLNVRVKADATSKIIDVVTKGTILEVLKPTENGWLELKSGGYIHGNYAKLISGDIKQSALVKKLSDEQNTGKNVVAQAPPPAINVTSAVPSKPSSTVKSNSGLSEQQIAKIFKDTALEDQDLEKAILGIEKMYGINSYFTIAVMKLESGHGNSQIAKAKNNLFGLNAIDGDTYNKALSFKTKGESVEKFGNIISEFYIEEGLTSIEKVAVKYCGANRNWPVLVKSIMNSDYKKIL